MQPEEATRQMLRTDYALQPEHELELAWLIHYLPPRDLAKANIRTVCRNWLKVHDENAWKHLVLCAGNPKDIMEDWNTSHCAGNPCDLRVRSARQKD